MAAKGRVKVSLPPQPPASETDSDRQRRIEEAAYYKAQSRGFQPGFEQQDWFEAERELTGAQGARELERAQSARELEGAQGARELDGAQRARRSGARDSGGRV